MATRSTGRPSKYTPGHAALAYKLCLLGATDAEIASCLGISHTQINVWKRTHPDFADSVRRGKIQADAEVAAKLFQRACGYSHPATKFYRSESGEPISIAYTVHHPPDTQAASLWLRNRQPARWRDKHEVDHGKDQDSLLGDYSEDQLIERLMQRRKQRRARGDDTEPSLN